MLSGKVGLVTSGASGFGAGIVKHFVDQGACVLILDTNEAAVEGLVTCSRSASWQGSLRHRRRFVRGLLEPSTSRGHCEVWKTRHCGEQCRRVARSTAGDGAQRR
jgi:NAD(P)-dependent dehydrogenase (short-subunit alcohol dehydrogenase family)